MRKVLCFFMVLVIGVSMSFNLQAQNKGAKLEVYYFHATNRCPTCNAIEDNALKVLNETYKSQIANGTVKFTSFNLDDKANEALVKKYEISFSTLLIIKKAGAKELKSDLTDMAFQYARTNPTKYASLLKAEIDKNLK